MTAARGTDALERGDLAVFLGSDLSKRMTGEVIYIDAGFNIMGVQIAAKEEKGE